MRFGLIGCGGIGLLRAAALSKTASHELAAVYDLDEARAEALTAPYSCVRTAGWRELVSRDDVDAVIVSTPPSSHAEMSIAALEAGKHVLCEKPLARTSDECQSMIDASDSSGRFLATGFNYRFYPSMRKARELLDSGAIGELDHIRSYTGYSATAHDHEWLHDADVMGGGALRDNGIHLIDLTCYFLGDAAEVKGFASNQVWGYEGCEDNGFALLRNSTGQLASLQASWTEWRGYRLLVEIVGSLGTIRAFCFPMITQLYQAQKIGGKISRKYHLFPKTQIMEKLKSYRWVVIDSFVHELNAFAGAAQGQKTAVASGQDGLRAIAVAEKASLPSSSS